MSFKERIPLQQSSSISITAGGSGSATITVPEYETWFIKSWTVTKGTNVTVSSIEVDSNDTYEISNVTDTESRYGALITSDTEIIIAGSNAGTASESLEIQVDGYKIY